MTAGATVEPVAIEKEGRTARIELRCRPSDKLAWETAADTLGLTLSQWMASRLIEAERADKARLGYEVDGTPPDR